MLNKLVTVEKRFEEVNALLCTSDVASDMEKYTSLMKELKQLTPIVEKYREYKNAQASFNEAKEMLSAGGLDKDFKEMVEEEFKQAKEDMEVFIEELKILLLPKDPNDDRNVIVEIRGGAGVKKVHCSHMTFTECTQCMPKQRDLRLKCSISMKLSLVASRK